MAIKPTKDKWKPNKESEAKMPKGQNVMPKGTKICGQRNMLKIDSKID